MTYREYLTYLADYGEEWNQPDRHDHYLMQIAAEIRSIFNKNVTIDKLKIPFKSTTDTKRKVATKEEREEATRLAKAAWSARLKTTTGVPSNDRNRTPRNADRGRR